ncbi:uncharacterized protein LOC119667969 [Teleopsis dalmanni]|uniref:uncharacterized protein LOC119667969 n=1 Tax=Teleopsis dalmanni TaxID=139649 RepID=UPI0018CF3B7B|nr:uncharacterized protein LOC119667969 [Teleopsis dalmanni]
MENRKVNAIPTPTSIQKKLSEEERFASLGLRTIPADDIGASFQNIEVSLAGTLRNASIAETTFNGMDISVNMENTGDQSDVFSVDSISECSSIVIYSPEDNSSNLSDSSLIQSTVETSYMDGPFHLVDTLDSFEKKPKAKRRLIF